LGRTEATGRGGVITLMALLKKMKKSSKGMTVAIQGFGNVGYYFAKLASEEGFKVVAISDSKSGAYDKTGINLEKALKTKKEKGTVVYGKAITNSDLLELPVDILVPAALENVINSQNMTKIKAKIIVEMANGPTTEEAYEYLAKKGTIVVPDVLANAGGVTVSYLEWVQGKAGYWWSEKEVNEKLKIMMEKALDDIWKKVIIKKIPLKQAAFETGIERIVAALV